MKKLISVLLACVLLLALFAGCAKEAAPAATAAPAAPGADAEPAAPAETITIKMAHTGSEATLMHKSFLAIEEYLESASNGVFQVDIYPNGQLGAEADLLSAIQQGDIQLVATNNGYFVTYNQQLEVFSVPFAFPTEEVAYAVLDGEFGQKMLQSMVDACGMLGVGYFESADFRELTASKAVNTVEDLKGLKIRVMPNNLHVLLWESLGASPASISFGELYTALQQGTVDAQENPVELMLNSNFYEVQDYLIRTNHIFSNGMMVTNPAFFDSLTPELQQILLDGVKAGSDYWREQATVNREEYYKQAEEKGMTVITLDDAVLAEMKALAQPVTDAIAADVGQELVDELFAAVDAAVAEVG